MKFIVRVHGNDGIGEKEVKKGTNLLDFLRENSIDIAAPCGGKGTCGKCRIKVDGHKIAANGMESQLLGEKSISEGYRLACYIEIQSDINVYKNETVEEAVIMTDRQVKNTVLNSIIKKKTVKLTEPDIDNQISDLQRVSDYNNGKTVNISLNEIRKLPELLRKKDFNTTFISTEETLIGIEAGDTTDTNYGIAIDIGTTTIASYLIDLNTGNEKSVYSCMNPQRKYGGDVISRINYTMEKTNGLEELNKTIVSCLNESIGKLKEKEGIEQNDIYAVVVVGNTTMTHILMGIPPKNIALAPFIPVTTGLHKFSPGEISLNINPKGVIVLLPAVSAYIGSDIVAAVISSEMHEDDKISLLIDIGTNGEVVLGNNKWMFSCSVAAGPAFEGAQIKNGVGGIAGAIDTMKFADGINLTTIGDKRAVGICGSGIVDAIAGMLDIGIIDEMGRMVDSDELSEETTEIYASRFEDTPKGRIFKILAAEKNDTNEDIVITQRDVRELQNAKAAVAAGIITLVKKAGIQMNDIDKVYLAGGFGSYLNTNSSLRIGLIPMELSEKIKTIGNAAGSGAVETLINQKNITAAVEISKKIKYIELSSDKGFVDEYIEAMEFVDNKSRVHSSVKA